MNDVEIKANIKPIKFSVIGGGAPQVSGSDLLANDSVRKQFKIAAKIVVHRPHPHK